MTEQQTIDGTEYEPKFLDSTKIKRRDDTYYNACFSGGRESAAAVLKLLEIGAPVDSLIFADTKIEKQPTYDFVKEFYGYMAKNYPSIPCYTVVANQKDMYDYYILRYGCLPIIQNRACTRLFKILPIYKKTRQLLRSGQKRAVQYIGMNRKEVFRLHSAQVGWIDNSFPLCDLKISREMCEIILYQKGLSLPPKSSCFLCPHMSIAELKDMYKIDPKAWARAKEAEAATQHTIKLTKKGRRYSLEQMESDWKNQKTIPEIMDTGGCIDGLCND